MDKMIICDPLYVKLFFVYPNKVLLCPYLSCFSNENN